MVLINQQVLILMLVYSLPVEELINVLDSISSLTVDNATSTSTI